MPMENCANLVEGCIQNIYACRDIAIRDPVLRKEHRAIEDRLFALEESLVHNQPALTVTLLHNRLRAVEDTRSQTMRAAVSQELKEIRQAAGHVKTGSRHWPAGQEAQPHLGT